MPIDHARPSPSTTSSASDARPPMARGTSMATGVRRRTERRAMPYFHAEPDNFPRPQTPERQTIDGAMPTPLHRHVDDLRSLPRRSLVVTLECAGNGRAFLAPPAPGEQWRTGAVGTAEWTGASLRTVLEMAGPLASAVEVVCVGADSGASADAGARIAYERS